MARRRDLRDILIDKLLFLALEEDVGKGDVTTNALIPQEARAIGRFVARQPGVVAGLAVLERLFAHLDPAVTIRRIAKDGEHIPADAPIAEIEGPARPILAGERVALNLLQRMCGVATLTRVFVEAVQGTGVKIYDTRKTMPGMRVLDKLAVFIGGGENHRYGLFDMVLIKDNHIALCKGQPLALLVQEARKKTRLPITIEVEDLNQLREVLEAEPEIVLLDNFEEEALREAVHLVRRVCKDENLRRPILEASGGITLENVKSYAATGVDRLSIGALTHSAVALDIGLDFLLEEEKGKGHPGAS